MNSEIRTIVVEDDEQSLQSLRTAFKYNFQQINLVSEARTVKEGLDKLIQFKPDLLLLDIMLPDGYGFDILQNTPVRDFEVIITSSQPKYALQAYNFSALHFIEKPLKIEQLSLAIDRFNKFKSFENINDKIQIAKDLLDNPPSKIMLPNIKGFSMYNLDDILYFKSNSNYTEIFFANNKTDTISRTLGDIEISLQDTQFCRIHNSFIININHLKELFKGRNTTIQLDNGTELPISTSKKDGLLQRMSKYVRFV